MSKWWHTLASVGLAALGVVLPVAQTAIAHHPAISAVLAALWGIVGGLLPSPILPKP